MLIAIALFVIPLRAWALRDPTAEEVVQAFCDEGLEVGEVKRICSHGDRKASSRRITRSRCSFRHPP